MLRQSLYATLRQRHPLPVEHSLWRRGMMKNGPELMYKYRMGQVSKYPLRTMTPVWIGARMSISAYGVALRRNPRTLK